MSVHNILKGTQGQVLFGNPGNSINSSWANINTFRALGDMYFETNFTTPITVNIAAINQWEKIVGLSVGEMLNVMIANDSITVGLPGRYQITGSIVMRGSGAALETVELGFGVNGGDPTGKQSLAGFDLGVVYNNIPLVGLTALNASDMIDIKVRNLTAAGNVDIAGLQFALVKISEL